MQLFYQPNISNAINVLDEEESRHVQKVLRLAAGDTIHLIDGKGNLVEAQLLPQQGKSTAFKVINKTFFPPKNYSIHVAIAPTKNSDRIEWFVEKAVEIGIQKISFIQCANSERKSINLERVEKKAISAMKQSCQYYMPEINDMVSFNQFIQSCKEEEKFIGFVDEDNQQQLKNVAKPSSNSLVLIGPEGDFSKDELALALKNNFKKISLGSTRLRTETAGIVAATILNLINER